MDIFSIQKKEGKGEDDLKLLIDVFDVMGGEEVDEVVVAAKVVPSEGMTLVAGLR